MALRSVKDSVNRNFEMEALKGTNIIMFYLLHNLGHNILSCISFIEIAIYIRTVPCLREK